MTEGCFVQTVPACSPVREVLVHQLGEAVAVLAFEQVRHFMHDEVLQALGVLLGELDVEPDA